MTLEEAQSVADIIVNADGGCTHCVDVLKEMCESSFPQFLWNYYDHKENEWDWGLKIQVTYNND